MQLIKFNRFAKANVFSEESIIVSFHKYSMFVDKINEEIIDVGWNVINLVKVCLIGFRF